MTALSLDELTLEGATKRHTVEWSIWHSPISQPVTNDSVSNYSCRRASIGSIWAARIAGYKPNRTPTITEIPNANGMDIVTI